MTDSAHILIVEDEKDLAGVLQDYLQASDYKKTIIYNGDEAETWLKTHTVDLVLLDLMLPGKSGLEVCKNLRNYSDTPVIMVTAKVEEIDRLLGLELGADDYICKPYSPREVVARIKAVLKRTHHFMGETQKCTELLKIHSERNQVEYMANTVELTTVEMALFELLYSAPGRIYSRQKILETIYSDYRVVSDRTVDSHVKKLRKKLQILDPNAEFIHSVYGAGYKYEPPEAGTSTILP